MLQMIEVYITYIFLEIMSCRRKATIMFDVITGLVDTGNSIDTTADNLKASCITIRFKHLNYVIYQDHARWITNQLTDVPQNAVVTEEISKSMHRADSGYIPYTDIILLWNHHRIMKISKWSRYWHYEEHIGMLNYTLR